MKMWKGAGEGGSWLARYSEKWQMNKYNIRTVGGYGYSFETWKNRQLQLWSNCQFFFNKNNQVYQTDLVILILLLYLVCLDLPAFFFYLLQMLDQYIFNVIRHRAVFICSKNPDFVKHFVRQTQSKYTLVGCHFPCPPFRVWIYGIPICGKFIRSLDS